MTENHVEDASHNANYPRCRQERNYFLERFFARPTDLFQQPTPRSDWRKIAAENPPPHSASISIHHRPNLNRELSAPRFILHPSTF
jgi:hypothetical protein